MTDVRDDLDEAFMKVHPKVLELYSKELARYIDYGKKIIEQRRVAQEEKDKNQAIETVKLPNSRIKKG